MVKIEGSYKSVRSPKLADFYKLLGEGTEKVIGSHWTMTVWQECPKKWGYYFNCEEHPELNVLDTAEENVEKETYHPLLGENIKILFKRDGDGFISNFKSVKCGEFTCMETYTDDGVKMVWTIQGSTFEDFWSRTKEWSGSYRTVNTHNLENVFTSYGAEFMESLKKYQSRFWQVGDEFKMDEVYGGAGELSSTYKLDEPVPFHVVGEDSSIPTDRRTILSQKGPGTFELAIRNIEVKDKEWIFAFDGDKLTMTVIEVGVGEKSILELEKFVDINGTFKIVTGKGFEAFAKSMGVEEEVIEAMKKDHDERVTVKDLGDGKQEHHFKSNLMDFTLKFKLGDEFGYFHPFFKENVKATAKMEDNVLLISVQTSKGEVLEKAIFKDSFVIGSMELVGTNDVWTTIYERI